MGWGGGGGAGAGLQFDFGHLQEFFVKASNDTINLFGCTYRGAAEGDYGVFTYPETGTVFAGSHANGYARVGVGTKINGTTFFVECDADGKADGRVLDCSDNGYTVYSLCEHGKNKEYAVLRADGTCTYSHKKHSAKYAPFVKLKAKVLPIKARPH